jgi:hypothetical protein
MSKRRRPRRPRPMLRPHEALPLDPEHFRDACLKALEASTQPHPRLHERITPHVILHDGDEESAITFNDTPLARTIFTLKELYSDEDARHSACWRLMAIGPLLEQPELVPWVKSRTGTRCEIDEIIFLVAATSPLNPRGEFLIKPFCTALKRWAAEHPDLTKEDEA